MKQVRDRLNSFFLRLPYKPFFAAKRTSLDDLKFFFRSVAPINTQAPLIRLGPNTDGGYLVPDDLDGITSVFSPGVSTVSGFELECAERGMEVYLADASVETTTLMHQRFHFLKKNVGAFTLGDYLSMSEWVENMHPDDSKDWLLQMDIEGSEYEVIFNIPEHFLRKFRIIIIEFHMLDHLMDDVFFRIASRTFEKLLANHCCVHIHPNNAGGVMTFGNIIIPKMMEFTFYRRDRISLSDKKLTFPHPFDSQNVPRYEPLSLPQCWLDNESL